jgi:hypothetical protein
MTKRKNNSQKQSEKRRKQRKINNEETFYNVANHHYNTKVKNIQTESCPVPTTSSKVNIYNKTITNKQLIQILSKVDRKTDFETTSYWYDMQPTLSGAVHVRFLKACCHAFNQRTKQLQDQQLEISPNSKQSDLEFQFREWLYEHYTVKKWNLPNWSLNAHREYNVMYDEYVESYVYRASRNISNDSNKSFSEMILQKDAYNFNSVDKKKILNIQYPYKFLTNAVQDKKRNGGFLSTLTKLWS